MKIATVSQPPTERYRQRLQGQLDELADLRVKFESIAADGADPDETWAAIQRLEQDIELTRATLAASERHDAASQSHRAILAQASARKAAEKAWDEAADEALKAEALLAKYAQQWQRFETAYQAAAAISPDREAVESLYHPFRPGRVHQHLFSELRRLVKLDFPATLMTATPQGWNLSQMLGRKRATLMPWLKK